MTTTGIDTSGMDTPPVVSPEEWQAARDELLDKEKAATRVRDELAAERRRLPWVEIDKEYRFVGPNGELTLADLFDGRAQLIVYRAFFEPGVENWPDGGCSGCAMFIDNVGHVAHLNERDTTFVLVSPAPIDAIDRYKSRMGWDIAWFSTLDDFSADFGVDEYFGLNVFIRARRPHLPHLLHERPRRRRHRQRMEPARHHPARPPGGVGGLTRRLPAGPAVHVVEAARRIRGGRRDLSVVTRGPSSKRVRLERAGRGGASGEHPLTRRRRVVEEGRTCRGTATPPPTG